MGSLAEPRVILYDYQFAPNAQKARNLLNVCGIPYKCCEQPFFQPRPILTDLGITYRRIPVNAIGKDIYCDNRVFSEAVQTIFKDKALVRTPADHAFESFGYRSFWVCLPLVPENLNTNQLADDRKDLFTVFGRPDYKSLRPHALSELKHMLDIVENDFLANSKCIAGDSPGLADIHAVWMIKWAMENMEVEKEPGFSRKDFPKLFAWIDCFPKHIPENDAEKISPEEASKQLFSGGYAAPDIGVDQSDPTGLQAGDTVTVETTDDHKPSNKYQRGKLVGLGRREIVIELENGLRIHFPRIGYAVKAAQ